MSKVNAFLERYGALFVFAVSLVFAVIATTYFYKHNDILGYNDARSRLNIARGVFDSQTPSIVQLGTIWPPLVPFLLLPFTINTFLWRTGLAGSIVSGAFYVIGAVYIYKIVALVTKNCWMGIVGALLFLLNANVIYMQSTAMTEVTLLGTLAATMYHLLKWLDKKNLIDLIISAAWVSVATLVRYEGWVMAFACVAVIVFEFLFVQRDRSKAEGYAILFATLGFLGIVLWLLWNLMFWGDPLYFLSGSNGQYSLTGTAGLGTTTRHHIVESFIVAVKAMEQNAGIVLLAISAISAPIIAIFNKRKTKKLAIYALILATVAMATNIITLFLGVTSIDTSSVKALYDVRYGIGAVLIAAIWIPLAIQTLPKYLKPVIATSALLACLLVPHSSFYAGVGGRESFLKPETVSFAQKLSDIYSGGKILATSDYIFGPIKQAAGIPLKNYYAEGNGNLWKDALNNPNASSVKYILMSNDPKNQPFDPVYVAYVKHTNRYNKHYVLIYKTTDYRIYENRKYLQNQSGKSGIGN